MSVFLRSGLFAASLVASECTVVITTGDLNSFAVFGLTTGEKVFTISAVDVSADPAHQRPCVSSGPFVGGKFVSTRVLLAPQGDELIGRSIASADGDLVLTLRLASAASGRRLVTGRFSGHAVGIPGTPPSKPTAARIVFDSLSAQTIDGGGDGQSASGNMAGGVTFIDAAGNVAKCDWVQWTMQPLTSG